MNRVDCQRLEGLCEFLVIQLGTGLRNQPEHVVNVGSVQLELKVLGECKKLSRVHFLIVTHLIESIAGLFLVLRGVELVNVFQGFRAKRLLLLKLELR